MGVRQKPNALVCCTSFIFSLHTKDDHPSRNWRLPSVALRSTPRVRASSSHYIHHSNLSQLYKTLMGSFLNLSAYSSSPTNELQNNRETFHDIKHQSTRKRKTRQQRVCHNETAQPLESHTVRLTPQLKVINSVAFFGSWDTHITIRPTSSKRRRQTLPLHSLQVLVMFSELSVQR